VCFKRCWASELRRRQTITRSSVCTLQFFQAYWYSGTVAAGWARVRRICFSGRGSTSPHTEQTSAGTLSNCFFWPRKHTMYVFGDGRLHNSVLNRTGSPLLATLPQDLLSLSDWLSLWEDS
jgi:hypothetical protein